MGWIIFAVCIIGFLIWFFVEEWSGGFDIGGFFASLLLGAFCGLVACLLICGMGSLIAVSSDADKTIVETYTYELVPSHTSEEIYITLDGSTYNFLIASDAGLVESEKVSTTFCDVQFSNEKSPMLIVYRYDFTSPVMRFIFWNTFDNYYIFTIPPNSVWLGPTID